jgi:hypothetical protein
MCKVYNTIGSLTTIKKHLIQNNIDNFRSVNELLSFQDNYSTSRQQIISHHNNLIAAERNNLNSEVLLLEDEISKDKFEVQQKLKSKVVCLRQQFDEIPGIEKSIIEEFTNSFKALLLLIQIKHRELFSNLTVYFSVRTKVKALGKKSNRLQYLVTNFEEEVKRSSKHSLYELDRKKRAIDEMNTFIYGAIGEQKVVNELEQLSNQYILINDFSFSFTNPVYYYQDKQYIKSIQIDHLLISPAGIFVIETKNWSKDSLINLSLRSPVDQIKRTNYALYKILSGNTELGLGKHHWGERKIPLRNLIVMITHKPKEEFEYVKILALRELVGYVEYFKPSLSDAETQSIAEYLIDINTQN